MVINFLLLDMNAFFKSLLFSMMAVEYVTKTTNFFDNFNFSHGRQTLVTIFNSWVPNNENIKYIKNGLKNGETTS